MMIATLSAKYFKVLFFVALISMALGFAAGSLRAETLVGPGITSELQKVYPGARIVVRDQEIVWTQSQPSAEAREVKLIADNNRGVVRFSLGAAIGEVPYQAWMPVWIPNQRVLPNQKLDANQIRSQDVDVAQGSYREYRALYLPQSAVISVLESRNTLLENQPILASNVRKIPVNRKGDLVKIRLQSGEISLQTQGTLEEAADLGQTVKVLSQKNKRLMSGVLVSPGSVEVQL
jgi:flagella basal body P-ring formation protein FlgA